MDHTRSEPAAPLSTLDGKPLTALLLAIVTLVLTVGSISAFVYVTVTSGDRVSLENISLFLILIGAALPLTMSLQLSVRGFLERARLHDDPSAIVRLTRLHDIIRTAFAVGGGIFMLHATILLLISIWLVASGADDSAYESTLLESMFGFGSRNGEAAFLAVLFVISLGLNLWFRTWRSDEDARAS